MIPIDGSVMFEIAPRFSGSKAQRQAQIIGEIGPILQATLEKYEIDTPLRIAHCLAQLCHESAGFRTTEEFADGTAYEGRTDLGNTERGDGPRYKGRGLLQLTGRANYRRLSAVFGKTGGKLNIDLEAEPLRAGEPRLSLVIACEYWKSRKINPDCDRDDIVTVTKKVNGGKNGLDDRRQYLAKAKAAIARIGGHQISGAIPDSRPVLHRGSKGDAVGSLQTTLQKLGFPIAIDEDFGAATELAVKTFQDDNDLTVDGAVGKETWDTLAAVAKKKKAA